MNKIEIKNNLLIIDCHNLGYAQWFAMGKLSTREMQTGVIFGFLKQLLQLSKKFKTTDFIFCWDSRKSYRKTIYKEYKKKRNDYTEQELKEAKLRNKQFKELKKILPLLGFKNNLQYTGLEADDLMAQIVLDHSSVHHRNKVFLVTRDNDLCQMLNLCTMYDFIKKEKYTKEDFKNEWGINPEIWPRVKSIAGCKSDEIPSVIPKCREKTAIKFLNHKLNEQKAEQIRSTKEIQKRNMRLVNLPFKHINIKYDFEKKFKKKIWLEIFSKYEFKTFLNDFHIWQKQFNLK